jgi:hypothetical protein
MGVVRDRDLRGARLPAACMLVRELREKQRRPLAALPNPESADQDRVYSRWPPAPAMGTERVALDRGAGGAGGAQFRNSLASPTPRLFPLSSPVPPTHLTSRPTNPSQRAGNELMERLAYYSLATDLVTRLDMLGASSASAASTTMTWQGACYLVSIFGAWTADARLGRYWTIVLFSSVYLVGLAGVVVSTGVAALSSRAWLMGALYIVALGTGGIKV